ncbi:MAG: translation initiation factor IF-2 N-terminal domain-containing protein, partial [Pseudonocardia sp.]|nr:translation initiation factor IF-2 N-terminal domain-containing protein [Pseudonocardia sp.]
MSINDAPAGETGGQSGVSVADLPERLRVHALAKLVGRTSKQVLSALNDLGQEVRSVQSNITRATAEQVIAALGGGTDGPVPSPAPDEIAAEPLSPALADEPVGEKAATSSPAVSAPRAPLFAAPMFQAPTAAPARAAAPVAAPDPAPAVEPPAADEVDSSGGRKKPSGKSGKGRR